MFVVAERFLAGLVKVHGKHPVSTDGGVTWYPMACRFLGLEHHIHFFWQRREELDRKENAVHKGQNRKF